MDGRKEIRVTGRKLLVLGTRDDEIAECNGRQIRPQDGKFLELLVGVPLDQQRDEVAHPAASEPRIGVLHYRGDVIVGKGRIFLGEPPLDIANKHRLFLRHLSILARILTGGQDALRKRFVV
jgi:hypothetical protein